MKKFLGVFSFALALFAATPAQADSILFDPDGAGPLGAESIDAFDALPGNALLDDVVPVVGDTGSIYYQANLGDWTLSGVPQFASCLDGADCFTVTVAIDVIVLSVTTVPNMFGAGTTGSIVVLGLDPNADTNVFNMYADTFGDDLSGLGFTTGDLILSGEFSDFNSQFTVYTEGAGPTLDILDQFGANNYPGIMTVVGGGEDSGGGTYPGGGSFSGSIDVDLSSLDTDYFKSALSLINLGIDSTSEEILPFGQVDPSACFSSNAVANCNVAGAGGPGIGPVNGLGTDIMTQTDANFDFEAELNPIPEPATLSLLGLGLFAGAALRRRQAKKRQ